MILAHACTKQLSVALSSSSSIYKIGLERPKNPIMINWNDFRLSSKENIFLHDSQTSSQNNYIQNTSGSSEHYCTLLHVLILAWFSYLFTAG